MNQTKTCPVCASEIEVATVRCQFCGSDLKNSISPKQEDTQTKKTLGRLGLELLEVIVFTLIFIYLYYNLPEDHRQWVDWLFGKDELFAPLRIIYLPFLLLYVVTRWVIPWLKNRDGLISFNKKTRSPHKKVQRNAD